MAIDQEKRRSVVITGASAGIGRALALEFAARGYHLGLTARRSDVLEAVAAEIRHAHPDPARRIALARLDVDQDHTVEATLHALFETLGGADIVLVNAGINDFTRVGRGQLARQKQIIQTNLVGAIATIDASVAYWLARKGAGHIVGVSSLASLQAIPGQAAYCATKAALSMYLDATRAELRRKNIVVTTILPGFVKTDIVAGIEKYPFAADAAQVAREIVSAVERRKKTGIVPGYPWKWLRPLFGHIPLRFLR
ncbi:MAG: SDR family NAD(P)-dependent oxidoreductase [Pseudomonadota bacterium]